MRDPQFVRLLNLFHERLREAKRLYEGEDDGGRAGMALAVSAAADLVLSIEEMRSEDLAVPLSALAIALTDLDNGKVARGLIPKIFGNRPPDTHMRQAMRAYASIAMELLMMAGFQRGEAAHVVINFMISKGVKADGRRTWTGATVANWRDQCRAGKAAIFTQEIWGEHDFSQYVFQSTDKGKLKAVILNQLGGVLVAIRAADPPSNLPTG